MSSPALSIVRRRKAKKEIVRSAEEIELRNKRNAEKKRAHRRTVKISASLVQDELTRLRAAVVRKDRKIAALEQRIEELVSMRESRADADGDELVRDQKRRRRREEQADAKDETIG
jgi:hypothetical protein